MEGKKSASFTDNRSIFSCNFRVVNTKTKFLFSILSIPVFMVSQLHFFSIH